MTTKTTCLKWLTIAALACVAVPSQAQERTVQQPSPIRYCVDPDWSPFEVIDSQGQHRGIAADLLALASKRSGVGMELFPTKDWPESLAASKAGHCQLLSLLNETPARNEWLVFTQPILVDENVLVTREEHAFIADLAGLENHTMVLPKGTSIEERVRRDFPNIKITITDSESEALAMVSERKADLTMRSLIVAAYTIKRQGWFNLKIAGQVPGYANLLRVGVINSQPQLRDALNKGVASITPMERQHIIDQHITINATTQIDYGPLKLIVGVFVLVLITSLFWLAKVNRAKRLAEQTSAQQQKFISMLSHEVRTPLAVIDAAAQVLIQRLPTDAIERGPVNRIRRGAVRLAYFFDNCLTVDRIDTPNFTTQDATIDIAQLVTWSAENAALMSPDHPIVLDIEPGLPALQADQVLLRIMLLNLLSNALKYSPATSPVLLRAWRKPGSPALCCFAVEDKGKGIPADEIDLIFEKYQRGRLAEGEPGAGLGLTLVSRIAELHGGTVDVVSQHGQGTQFMVEIPFAHQNARIGNK